MHGHNHQPIKINSYKITKYSANAYVAQFSKRLDLTATDFLADSKNELYSV